ncbi:NACHT, LRR and PYD domains-containing protein 12-like [Dendronephthya gigantea]|uniref:NACHT, LRR and PYD domains-containing protein 12-like n=1 Tax=Dendronephthya gigantea TaxID=151771 RepID=UPI0010693AFB|nr:NACHT, LRR and PYD domains-containing protein 12-like [Dendronephthya gigantea]
MENCLKLIPRNCYNTYSSVVLALFVAIGVVLLTIASVFETKSSLECDLDKSLASTLFKGKYIEARCLLKYAEQFLPSLPLTALIGISFGLVVVCSVVYGYLVKHRVDFFANNPNTTTNEGVEESRPLSEASPAAPVAYPGSNRYFVFMAYVIHLFVCRIIPLTIFSAFLLTSSNFPTHFECPLPNMKTTTSTFHKNVTRPTTNSSFVDCTYSMGGKKQQVVVGFITINFLVDAVTLVEIVYLLWSAWKRPTFKTDQEFITVYLEKNHAEATPNTSNPHSSNSPNQEVNKEIHEITQKTNSNSPNQEVNQEIHEVTQETNSNSPNQEANQEANQEIHEVTQETNSNSPNQEVNQEIHETQETNSNSPNQEANQEIHETQETNSNSPNQEANQEIHEITRETKSNSPNQEVNQEIHEITQETRSNSPNHEVTQKTNFNSPNQEANQEIHEITQETKSNSLNQEANQEIHEIIQETNSNSPNQEANQKVQEMIQENKSKHLFTVNDVLGGKRKLDEIYINVIIQDGREHVNYSRREFLKTRHEIYDIQLKKPPNAKVLENTVELFQAAKAGEKQPRTVLVVGRPGIGKTLLTEKISQEWQKGGKPDEFWHKKIVLLIKFRNFNNQETSLQEMLNKAHGLNKAIPLSNNDSIHKYIHQNPSNTILVFDGLDELQVDDECLTEGKTVNSLEERAHIFLIFKQLVNDELLPGITVLTTSRPTAEYIYQNLDFNRQVELLGFSEEQIEEYVKKNCGGDTKESSEIWNIIKDSPELISFCYIPVNSYIICLTLYESIDFGEEVEDESYSKIPKTITELYKRAIRILLFKHNSKHRIKPVKKDYLTAKLPELLQKDLDKLKGIARNGMEKDKLVFEFKSSDESVAGLSDSGVFNQLDDKRRNIFSFLHLTIQEFLAALDVVDDIKNVESFLSNHIDEPRWHLVIQFVAGLLGDKMRELRSAWCAESQVIECICKGFKDWMPKKLGIDKSNDKGLLVIKSVWEMQEDRVMKMISSFTSENDNSFASEGDDSFASEDDDSFASEGDDSFGSQVGDRETFALIGLNIEPAESTALFKFLSHIKNLNQLKITGCTVTNITIRELAKFLKKDNHGLESDNCELTELNVSSNIGLTTIDWEYFLNDALESDNCELSELNVSSNIGLTTIAWEYLLSDALKSDNCELIELNVSNNDLKTEGAKYLSDALKSDNCKLTELHVSNSIGLTTEGCKYLSDALKSDNCKLTKLNVRHSDLQTDGVKYLSEALKSDNCKLTELDVAGNFLKTEGKSY